MTFIPRDLIQIYRSHGNLQYYPVALVDFTSLALGILLNKRMRRACYNGSADTLESIFEALTQSARLCVVLPIVTTEARPVV